MAYYKQILLSWYYQVWLYYNILYASYFQFCNLQEKVIYFIEPQVTMSLRIHIRVSLFNAKNFELQIFCAHNSRKAYLLHTSTPLSLSLFLSLSPYLSISLFLSLSLFFYLYLSFSISITDFSFLILFGWVIKHILHWMPSSIDLKMYKLYLKTAAKREV